MIPIIRSLSELIAITESRDNRKELSRNNEIYDYSFDSGQRKRYIRSIGKKEVKLPSLPKTIRSKWIENKESISKFIDGLDYNNQIPSSYDLTLLERLNERNLKDAA
tara:strand:- start:146 stop:466 length:321 start_codon:yes stop_codon:yes gene_type:complete